MTRRACALCSVEVQWVRSALTGLPFPLDVEPTEEGLFAILDGVCVARAPLAYGDMISPPYFDTHTATCSARILERAKEKRALKITKGESA